MPTLATFIQHSIGSPSHSNQEKEVKGAQTGKKELKLSLIRCILITYRNNIWILGEIKYINYMSVACFFLIFKMQLIENLKFYM